MNSTKYVLVQHTKLYKDTSYEDTHNQRKKNYKVGKTMLKIENEGQEGYFLSEEEYLQLITTITSVEDKLQKIVGDSQ